MSNPTKASKDLVDYLKAREVFKDRVYPDQAGWDTIGYGHKLTPAEKRSGAYGGGVTPEAAEALLRADLERFEKGVADAIKVTVDQNQFDAMVSFAFNVGLGAFIGSSALNELNKGNVAAVPAAMARFNKVRQNGSLVVSNGLVNRRDDEGKIFTAAPGTFPSDLSIQVNPSTRGGQPGSSGQPPGGGSQPTHDRQPPHDRQTPPRPHDRQPPHDRQSHDRDAHDRDFPTHDRDVHDRDTHDRDTHDRDTHDRDTHDRDTHDRDTHDRDTHDRDTHDRDTHDRDVHDRDILP